MTSRTEMAPKQPRSSDCPLDWEGNHEAYVAYQMACDRRVRQATEALRPPEVWDSANPPTPIADQAHPLWALENENEVRLVFEKVLSRVGKASDLPLAGDNTPAAELLRQSTAGDRANARYYAAIAAAAVAQYEWGLRDPSYGPNRVLTALCLLVDAIGSGGSRSLGNGTSAREAPFSRLGSGRRQANDGAAWTAALDRARAAFPLVVLKNDPTHEDGYDIIGCVAVFEGTYADEVYVNFENLVPGVFYPLLGRALLAAHGQTFEGGNPLRVPGESGIGWGVELSAVTTEVAFNLHARKTKEHFAAVTASPTPLPDSFANDVW